MRNDQVLKHFLYSPGPTPVPEEVLLEMAKPLIHHRTPQFFKIIQENFELLQYIFQTKNPVITITSSGTGAMEASVTNFLSPKDKAIVLSAGKFGERFAEICRAYNISVIEIKAPYGMDVKAEELEKALKQNPDTKAVFTEYSETSTGVAFDIKSIAKVVKNTEAILVVDGISAIGAMEFKMDEWAIDVALAGSQKAFMIPPGLSFISFSEKAKKMMEKSTLPKYYFNLTKEKESLEKNTTAWTPAISLFIALNSALKLMKKEGLESITKRHALIAEACRKAVQSIGLSILPVVPAVKPSDTLTAVKVPAGIDGLKIPSLMRDKYGVTIAGGQESLKGKIFRLGHLGYFGISDIIIELQAMELALKELGYKFDYGKSVFTAQKVIEEHLL